MNMFDLHEKFCEFKSSKIAILPIPFDKTSTWIKGADKGPCAIINASSNVELYDIETNFQVCEMGIATMDKINEKTVEDMVLKTEEKVKELIDKKKFVVCIGGEHSISIGSIYAHAKKYENLSVLQLDAHSDLRNEYQGSKFNHACVMKRAKEVSKITQVGIRSMCIEEKQENQEDFKKIFFAKDIYNNENWIEKVILDLNQNVYVTIDLDVFDPSILPATGTPEPGGLFWYDVLKLLKKVCKEKNVVGFDIVELCPNKNSMSSDFLAAKLIYKFLSYKFKKNKK